ncbi:MAG: sulfur carrier protein ThiS adenylyltransferase ThiF [Coriobacteriia bacterium]|jgi:sulfur carrier protein ThiS adenylyltransferase|nr:sulfur carrier protein ThiS adenylyltransferase ThiF [Coriobacteriia bacterium]
MTAQDDIACRPPVEPADDGAIRKRLAASLVAIVGCGGLGSNVAAMLVRAGVGSLILIDYDAVEESNLNRQMFFRDQIGVAKVEALGETLRRIAPGVNLALVHKCMTPENLLATVGDADVVVEAADHAEVKAMVANVVCSHPTGMVLVAASGIAGIDSANDIATHRVATNFYVVGDCRSDVRAGLPLLASRVMLAAAHQAHATIRILLGHMDP